GISRFDFSGGSWTQTGSAFRFDTTNSLLTTGTAASGGILVAIRGLSGSYDSATSTATLFATTTETSNNRLISFLDTGSLSTSTAFTTLQSAGANYAFRGVDLSPVAVPEPSAIAIVGMGMAPAVLLALRRRNRRGLATRSRGQHAA
ncbi:MAG: PEP-CTERM sorting domain-containing protein, partial [Planctomycetaceae bacterium]